MIAALLVVLVLMNAQLVQSMREIFILSMLILVSIVVLVKTHVLQEQSTLSKQRELVTKKVEAGFTQLRPLYLLPLMLIHL